jgi:hypothetical protein
MEMEIDGDLMFRRIRTGNTVFARIALQMMKKPQIVKYLEITMKKRDFSVMTVLLEKNDKEFETTSILEMAGRKADLKMAKLLIEKLRPRVTEECLIAEIEGR